MMNETRALEHEKYKRAYAVKNYAMGAQRMSDAVRDVAALPCRGSYLDVGCGRAEMLIHASNLGFDVVMGTEIVPDLIDSRRVFYAEVHDLPFSNGSFNVVTMFDVIEHLIPGDDELACKELARVASKHILLTANNRPSFNHAKDDLHINKRCYDEWHQLFVEWFGPHKVMRIKGPRKYVSEGWRIDLQ